MSNNLFRRFVQEPTHQRYLRLRRQVMQSPRYDPRAGQLAELQACLDQQDHPRLLRRGRQLAAAFRLSPRYHYLLGQAAVAMEDGETARACQQASRACLRAILNSGCGDLARPHLITYLTDQYDVALALGWQIRCQQVVQASRRTLDVLTTHDGQQLWFDVTDLLPMQIATPTQPEPSKV